MTWYRIPSSALAKFHLWRRGSDMRAWMFVIMHNVFINQLKQRRELALDEAAEAGLEGAPHSDPLELRTLYNPVLNEPVPQRLLAARTPPKYSGLR